MNDVFIELGEVSMLQLGDKVEEIVTKYCPEDKDRITPEIIDELLDVLAGLFDLKSIDLKSKNIIVVSDNTPEGTLIEIEGTGGKTLLNIVSICWKMDTNGKGRIGMILV